jgi:hypothetical protein
MRADIYTCENFFLSLFFLVDYEKKLNPNVYVIIIFMR